MPLIKLYFTPALVLLVLTCSSLPMSQSLPVMGNEPMADSCVSYARTLLHNITDVLNQKNLFNGIDCTKQNVELYKETSTPSVCTPQGSTCSGTITSVFHKESCVTSIGKDLNYYYKFLAAQPSPTVLFSLRELMENCFSSFLPSDSALSEPTADLESSFDQRLRLCKVLKGFQVRAVTISRVISYMNAGIHTK